MKSCRIVSQDFSLKEDVISMFKSYIEITSDGMDKKVAQQLNNVFATNIHQQKNQAEKLVYNDFDVAFAVAMVFKLIVEQQIDILDYFCTQQANEKQKQALEMLKYIIYQLDKSDPQFYLNNFLATKLIPNQQLQQGINLSKIYSFVHLCELAQFFKPYQQQPQQGQSGFTYVFWSGYDKVNLRNVQPHVDFYFFQPSGTFPILVLQKYDEIELQYKIFESHKTFMTHISTQLILDAITQNLSQTSENLKRQPYKLENLRELAIHLLAGQPSLEDKVTKFLRIPQIGTTLSFLISPSTSFQKVKEELSKHQEQVVEKENVQQQQNGQTTTFDPFATQIPNSTQAVNNLRRTISY